MFILNSKPLPIDTPFEVRGVRYPANWLRLSSEAEKAAIGITEVPDQVRPDDRFYWVSQNENGTYTATPKVLEDVPAVDETGAPVLGEDGVQIVTKGLKSTHIAQVKATAGSLLSETDWRVIRASEQGAQVDATTLAARAAIRDKSNLFEEAILSADTTEELVTVLETINWAD